MLLLVLSGCAGPESAFTAEQAAVKAVANHQPGEGVIDPGTVHALQSQSLAGYTFVLVGYNQTFQDRRAQCLYLYEVVRKPFGMWSPQSGGGGCYGGLQASGGELPELPPLEIGSGTSSRGPAGPSFSHVNGLVYQEDIIQVSITWDDGQQTVVPVISGSYLAVRTGQPNFVSLQGLNAAGEIVYETEQGRIAP